MTVRDIGLAVVRMAPWADAIGRWVYARLPEAFHDTPTSRLRAHFAGESRVTFVQIGAYDGVTGDPIRRLVVENDSWSGVLIEPQPDVFNRLQRNYAAQSSRLQFLNVAISDKAGEKILFYISETEQKLLGLPDWTSQVASFNADHLAKHFPHARVVSYHVKAMTFEEAANLLPAGHVDVVVIDIEGHERAIIDTIDLERHRVKFIIYEHRHLSERDRSAVESRLRSYGFSVKGFGFDMIASRSLGTSDQERSPVPDTPPP